MAADTASGNNMGLEEVVVTAQRRTENLQDVPITIQAVSGEQLQRLNVTTMTELLKYTPNVTFSGNGAPGTGNIFMRGLSTGGSGNQSQSTTAPFPNVALYLDDQSMQFPARNNDVYLVDMERVEILEGPQGTLFGGGAQAGAVRYITNKPKLDQTAGTVNAAYGWTAGGDPNSNVNGTFNIPLMDGKLALRAVFFNDQRGGYIDNIPGAMSVPVIQTPPAPYGNPSAVNAGLAGTNTNTAAFQGGRLSALWKINDNWDALVQYNTQQFNAHGYWAMEPLDPNGKALQPFQTMAFAPAYEKDQYDSTSLTVNGDLGFLKAVYTGSYLDRHIDGQQDYSNYLRSPHGSYYACSGKGAGYAYFGSGTGANKSTKDTSCYAPQGSWRDQVQNTHQSHEVRFTTPTDKRLRALVGAFYENFIIYDRMDFNYMVIPQCTPENLAISAAGGPDCISAQGPMPGFYANDPSLRVNTNTAFGEDVRRGYSQTAFFGSVDFDIIPDKLTVTGGTRHYSYDEFEQGSEFYSASSSVLNVPNGGAQRGFGINLKKSESGFKSRGNLTWHVTPDVMVYYTYSEGFRPGGFNRTKTKFDGTIVESAVARYTVGGPKQFLKPYGYQSDNLTNNEVGVKSEWLDHRLQLNATVYRMDWKDVQLPLFDPTHLGNTTFVVNGPTYRVEGLELQFVARVTEGLTIQGSGSWNSTDQTNTPCLASSGTAASAANPTPAGACITQILGQPYANPFGNQGDRAAYSPALQYNVRAHYDWDVGAYKAFAGVGMVYTSWQANEPANFPNGDDPNQVVNTTLLKYRIPEYTTYDAVVGVKKDAWTAQLTINNLTNNDAATSISSGQYIKQVVPLRPRVITFGMGYNF